MSLDGSEKVTHQVVGNITESVELGQQLARKVLTSGGDKILATIKKTLNK